MWYWHLGWCRIRPSQRHHLINSPGSFCGKRSLRPCALTAVWRIIFVISSKLNRIENSFCRQDFACAASRYSAGILLHSAQRHLWSLQFSEMWFFNPKPGSAICPTTHTYGISTAEMPPCTACVWIATKKRTPTASSVATWYKPQIFKTRINACKIAFLRVFWIT